MSEGTDSSDQIVPSVHSKLASSDVGCHLCGESQFQTLVEGSDYEYACKPGVFRLVLCCNCEHVFADPMPEVSEIAELYPRTYYTVNQKSPLYLRGFVYKKKIQRDTKRLIRMIRANNAKSIVDIGCGDAARIFALDKATGESIRPMGLDLMFEQKALDQAKDSRVRLVEGNVESDVNALDDGGHDFMILAQLIEHLRRPRTALDLLHKKLSNGGRLLIETPNLGGLDYRLFKRKYWGGYHIPRHLHLFTRESLALMVTQQGYRVVKQGYLPSPGFWIISMRNTLGFNSIARSGSLLEFLNFSNLPTITAITAFDLLRLKLGMQTSNQYLIAEKI